MINNSGILPIQTLRELTDQEVICSEPALSAEQYQPNSLDLRVGRIAYRTRCSFLAVHEPVETKLEDLTLAQLDLTRPEGAILETGKVYVIPLMERLALPESLFATANPKSSTGRLDMLVRLLVDRGSLFDTIPNGYCGPLFLEVVPRAFPIRIRAGDTLAQLRIAHRSPMMLSDDELRDEIKRHHLIRSDDGLPIPADQLIIDDGVFLTILVGGKGDETIGYCARKSTPAIDLRRTDHPRRHYWQYISVPSRRSEQLILQPNEFYIFSSRQRVVIPEHLCAEMVPYDAKSGELRTHYAGFFDSGFGMTDDDSKQQGARVVLEVRNLDVPFLLRDGQRLFRLRFFRNAATPEILYGRGMRSNYQGQALRLSKHFGTGDETTQPDQLHLW